MRHNRFTKTENMILWVMTVLFLAVVYYMILLKPVLAETKENHRNAAILQEELNVQLERSVHKTQMNRRLTESPNLETEWHLSHVEEAQELESLELILKDALSYKIHKERIWEEDGILRRQMWIWYQTSSVEQGMRIMRAVEDGPFPCVISDVELQYIEEQELAEIEFLLTCFSLGTEGE